MPTINGLPSSVQTVSTSDLLPIDQVVGATLTTYKVTVGGLFAPLGTFSKVNIPAAGVLQTNGTTVGDLGLVGATFATGTLTVTPTPPVAGAGITVSGQTVTNSGILALTAGSGVGITGTAANKTITNSGVLTFGGVAGAVTLGIGASMSGQTLNVAGSGVTSVGTDTGSITVVAPLVEALGSLSVNAASLASPGVVAITATGLVYSTSAAFVPAVLGAGLSDNSGTIHNTGIIQIGTYGGSFGANTITVGSGVAINAGGTLSSTVTGGIASVVAGTGIAVASGNTVSNTGVLNIGTDAGSIVVGAGLIEALGTLSLNAATTLLPGGVIVGAGLAVSTGTISNAGILSLVAGSNVTISGGNTINASAPGVGTVTSVVSGTGLVAGTITAAGTINVAAATTAALGGVVIGSGITVASGTISVAAPGTGTVTSVVAGTGLTAGTITTAGTLNVAAATTAALGGVIAGTGISVASGTITPNSAARVLINQGTVAATGSTTISTDCSTGNVFTNTMTANATLANPTNVLAGATYIWVLNTGTSGATTFSPGTAFLFNSPYSNASPPALGPGLNVLTTVATGTATLLSVLQPGTFV